MGGSDEGQGNEGEMDVDLEPGVTAAEMSFGGLTFDDGMDGGVPICKHILACVLGERWSAALGRYVVERRIGREEMAGIVADA